MYKRGYNRNNQVRHGPPDGLVPIVMTMDHPAPQNSEEPIYTETIKVVPIVVSSSGNKEAILQIKEKYDTIKVTMASPPPSVAGSEGSSECTTECTTSSSECTNDEPDEVSEADVLQVEMFFQSQKTSVFVCPSLVNLYLAGPVAPGEEPDWTLHCTGIPVLLLDQGDSRARKRRRIQMVLAERGTGFVLWRDVIDNLTNYAAQQDAFHTMFLSTDHRRRAGLSFDTPVAAKQLFDHIEVLTSDPANISLSGPTSKQNRNKKQSKSRLRLLPERMTKKAPLKKADISQPCCFQHVTRVDLGDKANFFSLSTLTQQQQQQQAPQCGGDNNNALPSN